MTRPVYQYQGKVWRHDMQSQERVQRGHYGLMVAVSWGCLGVALSWGCLELEAGGMRQKANWKGGESDRVFSCLSQRFVIAKV